MDSNPKDDAYLQQRDGLAREVLCLLIDAEPALTINQVLGTLDYAKSYLLKHGRPDIPRAT